MTDRLRRLALKVEHLTVSYGPRPALLDVSVSIEPGILVGIIGPNGAGKSTLVKSILGFVQPDFGRILVHGKPAGSATGRIAYVPQRGAVDWDFPISVAEVALMGRYGHVPWYRRPTEADRQAADEALEAVGMLPYRERQIGELSGGQQQRVALARALAQEADLYLLDEPFAGVDAATERAIIDVLKDLRDAGKSVVAVHHDLATVRSYFDHVFLINVRPVAEGPVDTAFTADTLSAAYGGRLAATHLDQLDLATG